MPSRQFLHLNLNCFRTISGGVHKLKLEAYRHAVRKARNALFWTGGLIFLSELFVFFSNQSEFSYYIILIALLEAGVFVGLGFWTQKKPYTSIICGLLAFTGIILLTALINGYAYGADAVIKGLFSGVVFKVLVFVNLIRPMQDARALQEAQEQVQVI